MRNLLLILGISLFSVTSFADETVSEKSVDQIALEKMAKACEEGGAVECNSLGSVYFLGSLGVEASSEKALDYYLKSCNLNSFEGCRNWAAFVVRFTTDIEAHKLAVKYFDLWCADDSKSAKDPYSCYMLGLVYMNGIAVTLDNKKAVKYFDYGCVGNVGLSCTSAAIVEADNNAKSKKVLPYFEKGCDLKDSTACLYLAAIYGKGLIEVEKSKEKVTEFLGKACALDDIKAFEAIKSKNIEVQTKAVSCKYFLRLKNGKTFEDLSKKQTTKKEYAPVGQPVAVDVDTVYVYEGGMWQTPSSISVNPYRIEPSTGVKQGHVPRAIRYND